MSSVPLRYIFLIFAIFTLASCSVKKRTYRDGYYIDWAFHKNKGNVKSMLQATNKNQVATNEIVETEYVFASKQNDRSRELIVKPKSTSNLIDTCGDVITFKSGDQVVVKVTEITEDKIKYKRCDNFDGPVFIVNKGTVSTVKYANGVVEKIETPTSIASPNDYSNQPNTSNYKEPKKIHPKAIGALIALLCTFIPFLFGLPLIAAIILGTIAIKKINFEPDKFRGKTLATVVLTFAIIIVSLFLFVFIALSI